MTPAAGGNGENFEEDTQALITATLDKQQQASARESDS